MFKSRISDLTLEQVVDLKNFTIAGFGWLALASDDSPVMLRDAGAQDARMVISTSRKPLDNG